ncbi:hypothetical protein [Sphingobacterium tabacisoli]|uniref:AAA+ ATPase domain-containing protein n=1 Tax=Sphingobacterium tabacisoli TaxID=2044855 RepID=A0ABW5L6U5_9SPHI|nr:hypothetical protein [Sphingobacterium tabacisoli]
MNSKETLKIEIPDYYQIVYEESSAFKKSPFAAAYKKAKELIKEIIVKQELLKDHEQNGKSNKTSDSYNNIIAFTGERGIGKSSTMLSFMNALVNHKTNSFFKKDERSEFQNLNFISLEVIDPSLFRGEETIFEMVIVQMFKKFKLDLEQKKTQLHDDERRKLLYNFQKVYDAYRVTKKDNKDIYNEESIDNLINLAKGSNLRSSFIELVSIYLNSIGGAGTNKLIIAIDDFDLQIKGIYEMLEDIRQLLINNNVIILIAYKTEQLQEYLERGLRKQTVDISDKNHSVNEIGIKNQVNKYLEKILPNDHIINLLSTDQEQIYTYLKSVVTSSNKTNSSISDTEKTWYPKASNNILLKLIFETLDSFYLSKKSQTTSILYTPNLRSINELLLSFKDGKLEPFKKYIDRTFNILIDKDLVDQIWSCDPILLNTLTLNYCLEKFKENLSDKNDSEISIRPTTSQIEILNRLVKATNYEMIQFGDVVSYFKILKDNISITSKNYTHFQVIKLIYNLRRKELINSNPSYIISSSLSGLIHVNYLNSNQRIRREQGTKRYRDYFLVKDNPPSEPSEQAFVQYYGQEPLLNYLNDTNNPYVLKNELKAKYQHFTFNIYNKYFLFSLKDINESFSKLDILSQNTDFVIDIYEEIVARFPNLSKDGKTDSDDSYAELLRELEIEIKHRILPSFNIDIPVLYFNSNNHIDNLSTYFRKSIDKNQGIVKQISDIQYIDNEPPFIEIIEALEGGKQYLTLKRLFSKISDADINIKKFLSNPTFINQIKTPSKGENNKEGTHSTTLRKELKDRLIEVIDYSNITDDDFQRTKSAKEDSTPTKRVPISRKSSEKSNVKENNKQAIIDKTEVAQTTSEILTEQKTDEPGAEQATSEILTEQTTDETGAEQATSETQTEQTTEKTGAEQATNETQTEQTIEKTGAEQATSETQTEKANDKTELE